MPDLKGELRTRDEMDEAQMDERRLRQLRSKDDYLDEMYREKAVDLAEERFGRDFHDLPHETQYDLMQEASCLVAEELMEETAEKFARDR